MTDTPRVLIGGEPEDVASGRGLLNPDKPLHDPDMRRAAEEWESRQ